MAFITKSTLSLLLDTTQKKNEIKTISKEEFVEQIYNNDLLYYIFNKFQLDKLENLNIILSSNNVDLGKILNFKSFPNIPDPRNTVFNEGKEGRGELTTCIEIVKH